MMRISRKSFWIFWAILCVAVVSGHLWAAELGQGKVSAILGGVQKIEGGKTESAAVGDVIAGVS